MGRHKKSFAEEDIARRSLVGQRIKEYRQNKDWSQAQLAEKLDKTPQTIGRYERGQEDIPAATAKALAKETGIIEEYWQGKTVCKDRQSYTAELKARLEYEKEELARDLAAEDYARSQAALISQYKALFSFLGFDYEDLTHTAAYDFDMSGTAAAYSLTPTGAGKAPVGFTESEFSQMLRGIHEYIAYVIYRKFSADGRGYNGNS